jgi:dihydroxy-acid dehydratase
VPRVGVLTSADGFWSERVREAGGKAMTLSLPNAPLPRGVALRREWISDWAQTSFHGQRVGETVDALLVDSAEPARLAGLLVAALRLDLPVVVATPLRDPFAIALAAMGFAPLAGEPVEVAVEVALDGGPRPRELVEGFSLANALRAGLASGAGPELLVHLAAIAREAGTVGFGQMIRVLSPESPALADFASSSFEASEVFARLALHDTRTVAGRLREALPHGSEEPPPGDHAGPRLTLVRGRVSGTEAVCLTSDRLAEVFGECRVFSTEEEAVRVVTDGGVGPGDLLVVAGCGPRGAPGLLRLDRLGSALVEAGIPRGVPVLTDGLAPEGAIGFWASLFAPEAVLGGVIGRLRDGDRLRLDLAGGRIRTSVTAEVLASREPFAKPDNSGFGYGARYAASALPALEGAGFG